jgi:hypothetical protein
LVTVQSCLSPIPPILHPFYILQDTRGQRCPRPHQSVLRVVTERPERKANHSILSTVQPRIIKTADAILSPTSFARPAWSIKQAGRFGGSIPGTGRAFSLQFNYSSEAKLASPEMSTRGSLPGLKRQKRVVDHPPPSSVEFWTG